MSAYVCCICGFAHSDRVTCESHKAGIMRAVRAYGEDFQNGGTDASGIKAALRAYSPCESPAATPVFMVLCDA